MAVIWGGLTICPLKTREIAKGTDKKLTNASPSSARVSQFGAGLLTPPKRVTGGLRFPGAETAPESAPGLETFGRRFRRGRETRAEQEQGTPAEQEGAPNEGD